MCVLLLWLIVADLCWVRFVYVKYCLVWVVVVVDDHVVVVV